MPKIERKDISFSSADGQSTVAGYIYHAPGVRPRCLVQISHGMCEYIGRYAHFADYLVQQGMVVCGNDHLGHGATAGTEDELGFFTQKGGRRFALEDLRQMNRLVKEQYPGVPLVLLGHSMGSFFARRYAALHPQEMDGLILSGTGGPNPASGLGVAMATAIAKTRGPRYRSAFLHLLTFGSYLSRIPHPKTEYDWVCRDEEVVRQYKNDPKCSFRFTANGFLELYGALRDVSSPQWAVAVRKDMPVLMIQGDADPVGNYAKGTQTVRCWLQGAGVRRLEYIVYPGARHEVLNETNKQQVYGDVLEFINKYWGGE